MAVIDIPGFIEKLNNGEIDLDTWAAIVNANTLTTMTRLNGAVNTWFGLQAALSAATGLVYTSKSAMDAAPGTIAGQAARVTEGSDKGLYLWSGSAWVKTNDPLFNGPLYTAQGADFPFLYSQRGGATYPKNGIADRSFLSVLVIGPQSLIKGKLFKISYLQNMAVLSGVAANGIRIEEFEASTFSSSGTGVSIHAPTDTPASYDRSNPQIQTFFIRPQERPGLLISVTLDPNQLPPAGTVLNMSQTVHNGYSAVIDPSCYIITSNGGHEINIGDAYPLKSMSRGGLVSAASNIANNAFLNISVSGPAEEMDGKLYRLSYLQNKAELSHGSVNGIRLEEHDAATYATDPNPDLDAVSIHIPSDAPAEYDKSLGGIQTFFITPARRPNLRFMVRLNVDFLPPEGTQLNMSSNDVFAGWSWVIDPSCYVPVGISASSGEEWNKPMYASYTASTKEMKTVSPVSESVLNQFIFRPNGYNNLPNPRGIGEAPYGNPESATFNNFNFADSEWFGVMHLRAVNNTDGNNSRWATGGNHGTNGSASGPQTARCLVHKVYSEGQELKSDFSGYVDNVQIQFTNELMGYNTVGLSRYIMRQTFWVNIIGNTCAVHAKYTALEDLYVQRDSGLQVNSQGYTDTILYAGGANTERVVFDSTTSDSGAKTIAPGAWAMVMKGQHGQLCMWMDRSFGLAADLSHVDDTQPLIRSSKGVSLKMYNSVVYDVGIPPEPAETALFMNAGDSYEWRGGYAWGIPEEVGGVDSIIRMLIDQTSKFATVFPNGSFDKG
ncbi:hypothetical protein [Advenella mimigardefordensis]|uniref:Uncharacterized protein n=1 Tax=Advenella mimigardefordensis (strain DSM 17166 / LMG 22922 / DPN7) TaxID=1247726 RepID=W0PDW6_ADVMD|nr:hypothetical protein [Advenella mimigardefordensis]AHG63198.1 hypothetical protein MIM_c11000 [Advenella mimigardefordensis DPN7]